MLSFGEIIILSKKAHFQQIASQIIINYNCEKHSTMAG